MVPFILLDETHPDENESRSKRFKSLLWTLNRLSLYIYRFYQFDNFESMNYFCSKQYNKQNTLIKIIKTNTIYGNNTFDKK